MMPSEGSKNRLPEDEEENELPAGPFENDVLEQSPTKDETETSDYGGTPFGGSTKVHPEPDGLW